MSDVLVGESITFRHLTAYEDGAYGYPVTGNAKFPSRRHCSPKRYGWLGSPSVSCGCRLTMQPSAPKLVCTWLKAPVSRTDA